MAKVRCPALTNLFKSTFLIPRPVRAPPSAPSRKKKKPSPSSFSLRDSTSKNEKRDCFRRCIIGEEEATPLVELFNMSWKRESHLQRVISLLGPAGGFPSCDQILFGFGWGEMRRRCRVGRNFFPPRKKKEERKYIISLVPYPHHYLPIMFLYRPVGWEQSPEIFYISGRTFKMLAHHSLKATPPSLPIIIITVSKLADFPRKRKIPLKLIRIKFHPWGGKSKRNCVRITKPCRSAGMLWFIWRLFSARNRETGHKPRAGGLDTAWTNWRKICARQPKRKTAHKKERGKKRRSLQNRLNVV